MTHPHPKREFVPQAVLTRSGKLKTAGAEVNAVRSANTVDSKSTVNHPRLISTCFKRGHSQVTRPFNKYSANKNSIFNKKVNTVMGKRTTSGMSSISNHNRRIQGKSELLTVVFSKHMTRNKCYLMNMRYMTGFCYFGDGKGRISGKDDDIVVLENSETKEEDVKEDESDHNKERYTFEDDDDDGEFHDLD
ncbi:hypothetical protein Tco_0638537 [Tanacetum coccineum]